MAERDTDLALHPDAAPAQANPLSEREMDVARLLATGLSNAEIARELIISPHTVKVHLRNIFDKLQVNSRTEASMVLVQRGWLEVPGAVREPEPEPAPAPLPEPEPLADLPPRILPWQRVYLLAAMALVLLAPLFPFLRSQARTSAPLLSDSGVRGGTAPSLALDARWSALTPLPAARSRHGVAQRGSEIYILGGEAGGGTLLRDASVYDLETNRWRTLAPLPQAASNLAAAALGDAIYVAGGTLAASAPGEPPPLNDEIWRYAASANQWERLGPLPSPLAGAALATDGAALYLVGGWDGQAMRSEIWRYAPAAAGAQDAPGWELVGRLRSGRAFLGAVIVADQLYVVGGFDGQRELADADVYSLTDLRWANLPSMTVARSGFALVYDGLALVALGGGWLDDVETHERYDPTIDVWSSFPSPVAASWRHLGATSQDGRLYLFGGWSGDYLDVSLQYQSTFRALLPVITNP